MKNVVNSSQEQAVAAWIGYLNQLRLNTLLERLSTQNANLETALEELNKLKEFIGDPSAILGSVKTKHGEIAENVQVYFSNARNAINGLLKEYSFDGVGRTAPEDYLKNGAPVQSKFFNGLKATLNGSGNAKGILQHIQKYPDFVKNGGSYDIPKDQYEEMIRLLNLRESKPSQLTNAELKILKAIDHFEKESGLSVRKNIHPSVVEYREVQQGAINNTINKEEKSIKKQDQENRNKAYQDSRPTTQEGAKATIVGAISEGGIAFCMGVVNKRKEGKKLSDFTYEDWKELGIDTGAGTAKGAIRGSSVYVLTNFTETPANVATALMTALFGITAQTIALREGQISKEDFLINSETVCLDVTISTISSLMGQILIPYPVLGALIGNAVGMVMYEIAKNLGLQHEMNLIANHQKEIALLQEGLDFQYKQYVEMLRVELSKFNSLVNLAFDSDVNKAFSGSIELARFVGVPESKILKTKADIDAFFMGTS